MSTKPIQGFVEDLQKDEAYIRFPTLGVTASMPPSNFSPEDWSDLFEGAFVELDLDQKKMSMIRIPPPTPEEIQECIKMANEWFTLHPPVSACAPPCLD